MNRLRSTLVLAVVALSSATLVGCSLITEQINTVVQDATGGDGSISLAEVPADFPAEIPLPEGEVIAGAATGEGAWVVTIRVADEAAATAAEEALEAAGFTQAIVGYENERYNVVVQSAAISDGDGGWGVGFVVATKDS